MTNTSTTCAFDGCENRREAKGLCKQHRYQQRTTGVLKPIKKRGVRNVCDFAECEKFVSSNGLCHGHAKQRTKGQELRPLKQPVVQPPNCGFEGCDREPRTAGYCIGHYTQWLKGKELKALRSVRPANRRPSREVGMRDDAGRKECFDCKEWKPESDFYKNARISDGYASHCKDCERALKCNSYEQRRAASMKRVYGITPLQHADLLATQGGGCGSCGTTTPGPKGWCIDHDHSCCAKGGSCGECVRGILCQPCNLALGIAKDDASRLRAMANYLDAWATQSSATLAA